MAPQSLRAVSGDYMQQEVGLALADALHSGDELLRYVCKLTAEYGVLDMPAQLPNGVAQVQPQRQVQRPPSA